MRNFLLLLTYYLVITPRGLLRRWTNDPMSRQWDPAAASYWIHTTDG